MRRLIALMMLAGMGAAGVLAVKFLPWWALLAGLVALVVVGKWILKRIFMRMLTAPFKMKGAVLKGATAVVHAVTPTTSPTREGTADESSAGDAATRRYFWLDVTIQPTEQSVGFHSWEPGDLRLVEKGTQLNRHDSDAHEDDDACEVERVEVEQEGKFSEDEGWKLTGPCRLRLLLAVKPGVSALMFRYYFEEFGEVQLPAGQVKRAA